MDTIEIAIQVNGRMCATQTVPHTATEEEVIAAAASNEKVKQALEHKTIDRTVYVPKRLVGFWLTRSTDAK